MKLSPISVPYRAIQRATSILVLAFFVGGAAANRITGGRVVVAAIAVGAVVALIAYELAYYNRFTYELTRDTFDIHSGVISRREREIPYRRIQNVDIAQNVIQRALGIAAVGFETAGGSRTEGSIRFVSIAEARRLQREIQRRKRGTRDAGQPEPGAEEEELYAITPVELGLVGALSFDARIVGAVGVLVPGSASVLMPALADPVSFVLTAVGIVLIIGLLFASWLLGIAVAVVNYYGFTLTRSEDELRYERGLFRRYSGSIPVSKIQTVTIEDNPLKRAFNYATLTVETAGYAPGQGSDGGSQAAVPIARRDRVFGLAADIGSFGEPAFRRPPKRVRRRYVVRYSIGIALLTTVAYAANLYIPFALPWFGIPGLAALVPPAAHLKWKHRGYWLGPEHVVTRNGFWTRTIKVVPYYRIQTVIDTRSIFQRRWGLATLLIDTAGTLSLLGHDAAAVDIRRDEAVELRETLNTRLRESLSGSHEETPAVKRFGSGTSRVDPG